MSERQGWTPRELADYIGMSHDFILDEICHKVIRASRFGRAWRIPHEEVARYCKHCGWPEPTSTKSAS